MVFGNETTAESRIATFKAKWSVRYREGRGIQNEIAQNLSAEVRQRLAEVALRAYEAAGLRDYGRIDVRLAHDDAIYIVEANPNPYLAEGEDLAWAAEEGGTPLSRFHRKNCRDGNYPRRLTRLIARPIFLCCVSSADGHNSSESVELEAASSHRTAGGGAGLWLRQQ